jgi:cobalt/nickel transport system permease protein
MLRSEGYLPPKGKDSFINKSILALFRLLAKYRSQDGGKQIGFGVNAFFKLLFTLMLVLLISLSRDFAFILVAITYLLLVLMLMPAKKLRNIITVSIIAALISFLVMLPGIFYGNNYSVIILPVKVFLTVAAVNLLAHTSKWNELIGAIKWFHVPDIFIFVFDITIKYIMMLAEFTLEMMFALRLRSVGKNRNKTSSLSGVAGTMFVKSREMAEEMQGAMECRGFTGEYKAARKFRFSPADAVYILINAVLLSVFILLRGYHV